MSKTRSTATFDAPVDACLDLYHVDNPNMLANLYLKGPHYQLSVLSCVSHELFLSVILLFVDFNPQFAGPDLMAI